MNITKEELQNKINGGETVIVDFWAPFCGPCIAMKPKFEKIAQSAKVEMYTMDVMDNQEFASSLGIRAIPTIKVFSNGNVVESHTGSLTEGALLEMSKKYEPN
jgi:thioredoxin 1